MRRNGGAALLPSALCRSNARVVGSRLVPGFLVESDFGWLSALLEEHARFAGRRRSEWVERMRAPLAVRAPRAKLALAAHVLDRACRRSPAAALAPREVRLHLFRAAAASAELRDVVVERTARALGVPPGDLDTALFADLPIEQRVAASAQWTAADLARECNRDLVTSLVRRARRVRIHAGRAGALIARARRSGLICLVEGAHDGAARLDISGPFALFRHTAVYGRSLAELVVAATACAQFEIEAECVLGRNVGPRTLLLRSGDPIGAGPALEPEAGARRHRAREQLLERLRRVAPDWDVVSDPAPVRSGRALLFADLALVSRADPDRRWLVECVGFWTSGHLVDRAHRYREAGIERVVFCVDARRGCGVEADAAAGAGVAVVTFRGRIDPRRVLAALEAVDRAVRPGDGASEERP